MIARIRDDYLSTAGRLPRLAYWLRSLAAGVVTGVLGAAAAFVEPFSQPAFVVLAALAVLIGVATWGSLAIRRFHDHGRSGWLGAAVLAASAAIAYAGGIGLVWTPVATLAGVVSMALSVYLGFVRGVRGPTVYGPDPLAG